MAGNLNNVTQSQYKAGNLNNVIQSHYVAGNLNSVTQSHYMAGWLVGCLFNSKSTHEGQFVPTAGEGNRLSQLNMANEIQSILPYVTR